MRRLLPVLLPLSCVAIYSCVGGDTDSDPIDAGAAEETTSVPEGGDPGVDSSIADSAGGDADGVDGGPPPCISPGDAGRDAACVDSGTPPVPDGYLKDWGMPVFEDLFDGADGTPPDPQKWRRRGLPGSDYYLTNTDRQGIIQQANAYVEGGKLVLKTQRRASPLTPDAYTRWYDTAYIDTMPRSGWAGFEQRYGRWEARVHSLKPADSGLPASAGIWSSFWLRTNQSSGEVDIFEHLGTPAGRNEDGTAGSYTYASRWPSDGSKSQAVFFESTGKTNNQPGNAYHEARYTLPKPYFGWHTYAAEWTPDRFSAYCDGTLVGEIRRGVRPNNNLDDGAKILDGGWGGSAKAHMRIDVHVGFPNAGMASVQNTQSPHYFYVDYVRAWAWNGQP